MFPLLAFASQDPREIAPFLSHLARLSAHGNLVDRWERRPGGNHPDGWGIAFRQKGETRRVRSGEAERRKVSDTLVFLETLADRWKERTRLGLREALSALLGDVAMVGTYSAANLLIAHGGALFALRHYRKDADYYTLFLRAEPGLVILASEPLDASPRWRALGNGELVELCQPSPRSLFLAKAA